MRVKIMTFRYSATLGGFDDTALVTFTRDKEVISFREHFYTVNEVPHLSCIVHYQDAIVPHDALQAGREISARAPVQAMGARQASSNSRAHESAGRFQRRDGAPDPCEGLSEQERALFNHLREWRSAVAHADGVPPYLILTNRQLVAIVRGRPDSPTALGHIDGIGPGKLERYGNAILARLHGASSVVRAEHASNHVEADRVGSAADDRGASTASATEAASADGDTATASEHDFAMAEEHAIPPPDGELAPTLSGAHAAVSCSDDAAHIAEVVA